MTLKFAQANQLELWLSSVQSIIMAGTGAFMCMPSHCSCISYLVLVIDILTYVALLPVAKEYWNVVDPTAHCTGYQEIPHRPSPSWARSRAPVKHSGHSSVAIAYCVAVDMGFAPDPARHSDMSKRLLKPCCPMMGWIGEKADKAGPPDWGELHSVCCQGYLCLSPGRQCTCHRVQSRHTVVR